ncbi:polysaccharide biosynthesis tyrosine autokinase [uncultured Chitinophaga sp.]|uniref:GumC family protein n=1 Tax=uncultured Chitinophaga sp. TaxID=339340 RepID=UPI0025ED7694|nr:polysaccharide biosynthesis tyrosine autokinase [uncultured Chitinophaga sp.]
MQKVNAHNKQSQPDEKVDLVALIRYRYLAYWPLFLIVAALSVGAALLYLRYATPVYRISSTLLVKDEQKDLGESNILAEMDLFGSKKNIENEIQILTSRTLAREVIRNLNLFADVYEEGQIRNIPAYDYSPVKLQFLEPERIMSAVPEKVPLQLLASQGKVILNNKAYPLNDTVSTPWGKMKITALPGVKDDKIYHVRIVNERQMTQEFMSRLKVTPISKMATVINLEYTDIVPNRGQDVLNELMKVYTAASIKDKNKLAASTMEFLNKRLEIVTKELSTVEGKVEQFKTASGIVDISEQSKLFLESVQENDRQLSESSMQLSVLDAIERHVSGKTGGQSIVPATLGISDPVMMELLSKLYQTEMEIEALRKTTGENSPRLQALNRQVEKLTPSILENIHSLRENFNAGRQKLVSDNGRFMSMLRSVPAKERALVEVGREKEIKAAIYTFLLQKREETALAYSAAVSDNRIVDAAEPESGPFSPRRSMVIVMALAGGIVLVIAFITLKDMMNRELTSRSDIEKVTSAPIVAEILYDDSNDAVVIADGRRSLVAEQFRTLRTSLSYIGLNGDNKTLLVTSSISGEGKSFISVNLAVSLSLIRKKVVLLEFDLRKPMISKMMKVSREPGITNYLVGRTNISDMLRQVEGNEYLYILPAGVIPPNPTELILNGRLEEMLRHLKTMFDYVIIDTAPVGLVSDARLLAPFADATLYVTRHQVTPRLYLKKIDDLYRSKELGKLNIVFNGVKVNSVQGHSYGYGYGYTEEVRKKKNGKPKSFIKGIFNL